MTEPSSERKLAVAVPTVPAQAKHTVLTERRYLRRYSGIDLGLALPFMTAGALAGAGTYSGFVASPPSDARNFLFLGAAIAAVICLYRWTVTRVELRVGDAGVAVERGGEMTRLLWSEIQSIRYENQRLVLTGANTTLRIETLFHAPAIVAIVQEARERLPEIVQVPATLEDELARLGTAVVPEREKVRALQLAGKRCVASKQLLTTERDARLCPNCMSVYHRDQVPTLCVTCGHELLGRTVSL